MKHLRILIAAAVAFAVAPGALAQQTGVAINATTPPGVQQLGAAVSGTAGQAKACYMIVTNFVGGAVQAANPICLQNIPNTLSSGNFVLLTWRAVAGAVTYDILKASTAGGFVPGAATALATAQAASTTTYSDIGGSLSAYTQAAFPYSNALGGLILNNRDFVTPTYQFLGGFPENFQIAAIIDANGNTVLQPIGVAGAVDWATVTNAAAGGTVKFGAAGSDSNIPINIAGKGTGGVSFGSSTSNFDSTGAALNQVYTVSSNVSIANVNTGTVLVAAVSGRTLKIEHVFLQAIGGAVATCTTVRISDTTGSPVDAVSVAIAALTQNTVVTEATPTTVTLSAFAPTALTASQGIQIRSVGTACATATSINVIVFYTINS